MIAAQHSASTRKGIWRPLEKLTAGSLVQTKSIWLAEQTICRRRRRRRRCLLLRHASSLNPATGWPVSPSISLSPLPLSRLDLVAVRRRCRQRRGGGAKRRRLGATRRPRAHLHARAGEGARGGAAISVVAISLSHGGG
jgi:hypothetical protein